MTKDVLAWTMLMLTHLFDPEHQLCQVNPVTASADVSPLVSQLLLQAGGWCGCHACKVKG